MGFFKTTTVADQLGVPYYRLFDLLRSRQIAPPAKDSSGDYVWTEADVERARAAIQARLRRRAAVGCGSEGDQP